MKWFIIALPDTEQEREMCLSYILNWILKGEGWRSSHGCTVG